MAKNTGTFEPGHKDQLKLIVEQMTALQKKVSLLKDASNPGVDTKFNSIFQALKKADEKINKRSNMLIALFQRIQTLEQAVTLHRSIINGMSDTLSNQSNLFHKLSGCNTTSEQEQADEIQETEEADSKPDTSTKETQGETLTTQQAKPVNQSADSAEQPKKEINPQSEIQTAKQSGTGKETVEANRTNKDKSIAKRRAKRQARKASKKRNR